MHEMTTAEVAWIIAVFIMLLVAFLMGWRSEPIDQARRRRFRFLMVPLGLALIITGCSFEAETPGDRKPTPVNQKETTGTLLADEIDAGQVKESDDLLRIVDHLKERGQVTDDQVNSFDLAFPKFRENGGARTLTKSDSQTLRSLFAD